MDFFVSKEFSTSTDTDRSFFIFQIQIMSWRRGMYFLSYLMGKTDLEFSDQHNNIGSGTLKWPAISIEKVVG